MAPTVVSSIAQSSAQQLSTIKSGSVSAPAKKEESKSTPLSVTAGVAKDDKSGTVDSVRISFQALQSSSDAKKDEAKVDGKKDEAKKVDAKKETAGNANNNVNAEAATAKVQFVYNQKGDLITRYLNSSGELIYQVPSKLMLLTQEAELKSKSTSNSSVDTRV